MPFQRQGWRLVVDGMPVEAGLLGALSLGRLPLTPGSVASVEAASLPGLAAGRPAPDGALRLRTRRPAPGLRMRIEGHAGNEVGDPGPHRYTPHGGLNVDKRGLGASVDADWGGGAWSVASSHLLRWDAATDPLMRRRLQAATVGYPTILVGGSSVRVRHRGEDASHRAMLAASLADDLPFVAAAGRELPLRSLFLHAGAAGERRLEGPWRLGWRARLGRNGARSARSAAGLEAEWTVDEAEASVRLERREADRGGTLELDALRRTLDAASLPTGLSETLLTLSARGWKRTGAGRAEAEAALLRDGRRWGGQAGVRYRARLTETIHASGAVTAGRRLPATDPRPWRWRARGWDLLERVGARIHAPEPGGDGSWLAARAAAEWTSGRDAGVELEAALRREWGATLERYKVAAARADGSFPTRTELATDVAGTAATLSAEGRTRLGPALRLRARAGLRWTASGDPAWQRALEAVPGRTADVALRWRAAASLELEAAARHRGPTRWAGWQEAGGRLPGYTALDAAARKWLGDGRMRITLRVRNALGAPVRSHPAGRRVDPSVFLSGEVFVGGGR